MTTPHEQLLDKNGKLIGCVNHDCDECKRREAASDKVMQPEPSAKVAEGWRVQQNSDGSIGIFAPAAKAGESRRTSHAIYPNNGGDLGEIMFKYFSHVLAATPTQAPASSGEEK